MADELSFSFQGKYQISTEAHLSSYSVDAEVFLLDINNPVLEADHSPPSSANVKNVWSYTTTFPHLCVVCLIKHASRFTVTLNCSLQFTGTHMNIHTPTMWAPEPAWTLQRRREHASCIWFSSHPTCSFIQLN